MWHMITVWIWITDLTSDSWSIWTCKLLVITSISKGPLSHVTHNAPWSYARSDIFHVTCESVMPILDQEMLGMQSHVFPSISWCSIPLWFLLLLMLNAPMRFPEIPSWLVYPASFYFISMKFNWLFLEKAEYLLANCLLWLKTCMIFYVRSVDVVNHCVWVS